MGNELKPCPFCGHVGLSYETKMMGGTWWQGKCACGIRTAFYQSKEAVIRVWSKRPKLECDRFETLDKEFKVTHTFVSAEAKEEFEKTMRENDTEEEGQTPRQ